MHMKLLSILKTVVSKIDIKQDSLFNIDIKKQKKYVSSFPEPSNDMERSYYQYKCQMKLKPPLYVLILNFAAIPLYFYYLLRLSKNTVILEKSKHDMVFFRDGKGIEIIPPDIYKQYKDIEINPEESMCITKSDLEFIKLIAMRHMLSPYFLLKILLKIAKYSYVIQAYSPKGILVCAEYSFTSSILTQYCSTRQIKHINTMHGEKLYDIKDSFFRYDKCYVWDEYYVALFTQLRAELSQFIIQPLAPFCRYVSASIEYTYYLAGENKKTLSRIKNNLDFLSRLGCTIVIRPHPRYSDITLIKKVFQEYPIQDPKTVSINDSLGLTKYAISLYSTTLNQALANGRIVVIDDISNAEKYKKLRNLQYIILNKPHLLLSELIRGSNEK